MIFITPNMGMKIDEKKGEIFGKNLYDGTGADAANILVDGVHGHTLSPSGRWFRMSYENVKLKESEAGKEWLQEGEEIFSTIFSKSNFHDGMGKEFYTGCTYGTATIYVEDDLKRNTLNFSARSPWEIYIDTDNQDRVDTVFRKYKQKARNIAKRWKGNLPKDFERKAKENPYEEYTIIHAVFPREERDQTKIDKKNKSFASIYVLDDMGYLLSEGGYDSLPYIVWRFKVLPGEPYGRSFAWDALTDIKIAQAIMRTMLKAGHRAVEPPLNVPMEQKGRINLEPNGMNYYVDPSRQVAPINTGGNYPIGIDIMQLIQGAVKKHFRVEFFTMWAQLSGQKNNDMTATEFLGRQGEQAATLAPMVSRVESELLNPLFDRVFSLAQKNGWLPPIPPELEEFAGAEIRVDYNGPLAQAMKKHWNTQQINQTVIQYTSFFELWPEMRHRLDPATLGRFLLEEGGLPEKLIVDDAVYQQLVEGDKEMQAQAMAQQNGIAQAQVFDKLNQAIQPNSPAEGMF